MTMLTNNSLIIPDYVTMNDISTILNWFHHYNIADIENITFYEHEEQEYYVENENMYGYVIIKIKEWYINNSSKLFYEKLETNNAKIVYDDPHSWNVEFLEEKVLEKDEVLKKEEDEEVLEDETVLKEEYEPFLEEDSLVLEEVEEDEEVLNNYLEEYSNYNNNNISNYIREHKKTYNTRYRKTKAKLREEDNEKKELSDILIKKNKNYLKRNKEMKFKNVWSRRLREKLNVSI